METYEGIYENGVVRFPGPVALPDHTKVTVTPKPNEQSSSQSSVDSAPSRIGSNSDELYALLDARYNSGCTDTAARHNEHQP